MKPDIKKIIKMMHQKGVDTYKMDHEEAKKYNLDIPEGATAEIKTDFVSGGKIEVSSPRPYSQEMLDLAKQPMAVKNPIPLWNTGLTKQNSNDKLSQNGIDFNVLFQKIKEHNIIM